MCVCVCVCKKSHLLSSLLQKNKNRLCSKTIIESKESSQFCLHTIALLEKIKFGMGTQILTNIDRKINKNNLLRSMTCSRLKKKREKGEKVFFPFAISIPDQTIKNN